jgi:hypothetical protein
VRCHWKTGGELSRELGTATEQHVGLIRAEALDRIQLHHPLHAQQLLIGPRGVGAAQGDTAIWTESDTNKSKTTVQIPNE